MLHETVRNQNPAGLAPRGYGFGVVRAGSPGCSDATFGHTGSTGTLAWADPRSQAVCVVLTSLPAQGVNPHPRDVVATHVARQVAAAPQ
jgi:CubicO group peptidase (beta-lactamase class C family)